MKFKVVLEPQQEGGYVVYVPGLPGCLTQADTKEEAIENIKEAIEGYFEVLQEIKFGNGLKHALQTKKTIELEVFV